MGLLDYSAVIRGNVVIASFGELLGFSERELLRLVPEQSSQIDQKITSGRLVSFITTPGLVFVAVSQQPVDKQRPLTFLETLSRRWAAAYGPVSASAADHALDQVLASNFAALFNDYSTPTKTAELARQLDETQQILTESMTKALDRGAELDSLSSKSEDLLLTSWEFRAEATNLKWTMRCAWIQSWAARILIVLVFVYFLLSWLCGGFKLQRCLRRTE
jgi:vesicle-associated membrane protein 7